MLTEYDGAFIGTATDFTDLTYRFQIEEWMKDPGGLQLANDKTVEIATSKESVETTCDFSAAVGISVAVFFDRTGDLLHSNTCGSFDADNARLALRPPDVATNAGPGTTLIAETSTSTHLWLLDANGNLVSTAPRPQGLGTSPALLVVEQCVDSSLIVEGWWSDPQQLVVRDVLTMEIVRTIELSKGLGEGEVVLDAIACLDDAGTELVAAFDVNYGDSWLLLDPDDQRVIANVASSDSVFTIAKIAPDEAMAVHLSESGLLSIDLDTGEVTLVDALEGVVSDLMYDPFAIGELSPDGKHLAVYFNELSIDDRPVERVLLMADLTAGTVTTQAVAGTSSDSLAWLGSAEVLIGSPESNEALLVDATTNTVSPLEPFCEQNCNYGLQNQQFANTFVATMDGVVVEIDRATRAHDELIKIPVTFWSHLVQFDAPITVTRQNLPEPLTEPDVEPRSAQPAATTEPVAPPAPVDETEQALAADPEPNETGSGNTTGLPLVLVSVATALTLAFVAFRASGRRS